MANISIGGRLSLLQRVASLDLRYGPYSSIADAYDNMGPSGDEVITAGLPFGVTEDDGSVSVYIWTKGEDATQTDCRKLDKEHIVLFNGFIDISVPIKQQSYNDVATKDNIVFLNDRKQFAYRDGLNFYINWKNRYVWSNENLIPYDDVIYIDINDNKAYYYNGTTLTLLASETFVSSINNQAPDENGNVNLTKEHIGLEKVDNTSDTEKVVKGASEDGSGNNIATTYETKSDATTKNTAIQNAISALQTSVGNLTGLDSTNFGGFSIESTDADAISNIATIYTADGYTNELLWYMAGTSLSSVKAYRYNGSGTPTAISSDSYDCVDFSGLIADVSTLSQNIAALGQKTGSLDEQLNGLPTLTIDLDDYDTVNGTVYKDSDSGGRFLTTGNYGLYHRSKIVPVSDFRGRTIRIVPVDAINNYSLVTFSATSIDPTASSTTFSYATGYTNSKAITIPNDIVIPDDAVCIIFYITDTRETWTRQPQSVSMLGKSAEFLDKSQMDVILGQIDDELEELHSEVEIDGNPELLSYSVGYVLPYQTIGQQISLSSDSGYGNVDIYSVPSGKRVKVSFSSETGGYGFALCTSEGVVIQYTTNNAGAENFTFDAPNADAVLYVSSFKLASVVLIGATKIVDKVLHLEQEIERQKADELPFFDSTELSGGTEGNNYILPYQSIGHSILFGEFGSHIVFDIPAKRRVRVTTVSGGSYGFALTDAYGNVLENFDNSQSQDYTFALQEAATKLYVSSSKYDKGYVLKQITTSEKVAELSEEIDDIKEDIHDVQIDSFWKGKKIWWCGTSIPAGSDATLGSEETIAGNYPTEVGNDLGATVINKAVGASMCRANVRTGDYVGANFSNITSCLSMTKEEIEDFIDNYATIKSVLTGNVPDSLNATYLARLRAASFEDRLIPYLDGTYDMPDLFVFDHGHNDFKYKLSGGATDIGLEPTTTNIGDELAEDTFMTANNCAKLESFFGSLANIPSARKEEFIASVNRNCYIGAANFIFTLILRYNPHARIVIITNYEYENGDANGYAALIPVQEAIAKSWAFPICRTYEVLGYSNHIIPSSMAWFNSAYPSVTPATTDVTVYKAYLPDGVHPHSDITGDANNIYAGIISEFIKKIR